jgi:hypothetical protein
MPARKITGGPRETSSGGARLSHPITPPHAVVKGLRFHRPPGVFVRMIRAKNILFGAALGVTSAFPLRPCFGALTWENQRVEQTLSSDAKRAIGLFRFKNDGELPVEIVSVKPTCGCTTAELERKTYAPGESGEIKAIFTFDGRVGFQEKLIAVVTNDAPTKPLMLELKVNIQEPLTCTSHLLLWRIGDATTEKKVVISPILAKKIVSLEAVADKPNDVILGVTRTDGGKFDLSIRPSSTTVEMNVAISCSAKFESGEIHPFKIFALVR